MMLHCTIVTFIFVILSTNAETKRQKCVGGLTKKPKGFFCGDDNVLQSIATFGKSIDSFFVNGYNGKLSNIPWDGTTKRGTPPQAVEPIYQLRPSDSSLMFRIIYLPKLDMEDLKSGTHQFDYELINVDKTQIDYDDGIIIKTHITYDFASHPRHEFQFDPANLDETLVRPKGSIEQHYVLLHRILAAQYNGHPVTAPNARTFGGKQIHPFHARQGNQWNLQKGNGEFPMVHDFVISEFTFYPEDQSKVTIKIHDPKGDHADDEMEVFWQHQIRAQCCRLATNNVLQTEVFSQEIFSKFGSILEQETCPFSASGGCQAEIFKKSHKSRDEIKGDSPFCRGWWTSCVAKYGIHQRGEVAVAITNPPLNHVNYGSQKPNLITLLTPTDTVKTHQIIGLVQATELHGHSYGHFVSTRDIYDIWLDLDSAEQKGPNRIDTVETIVSELNVRDRKFIEFMVVFEKSAQDHVRLEEGWKWLEETVPLTAHDVDIDDLYDVYNDQQLRQQVVQMEKDEDEVLSNLLLFFIGLEGEVLIFILMLILICSCVLCAGCVVLYTQNKMKINRIVNNLSYASIKEERNRQNQLDVL